MSILWAGLLVVAVSALAITARSGFSRRPGPVAMERALRILDEEAAAFDGRLAIPCDEREALS